MTRGVKALALAVLWLVPLITLSRALTSDWVSVWQKFYFPVYWGPFMDLQAITSGVKTQQMGGDPILSNPADRSPRVLPYPKIWLHLFSWMGINDANVSIVGVTFCICYLICVSRLIMGCSSAFGAVVLLAAGLSLAPLFAIERGNIDLFIFSLVFFGCSATNRFLKSGAYFAATALKIYPIAALLVDVIRRPLKASTVSLATTLSAFALFAWEWRDLKAIRRAVPADPYFSFGSLTLRVHAAHMSWKILACSCVAAALIAGAAWLTRPNLDESVLYARWREMFVVFGGIYVFTFAVSSNYNYRLIFLVPTLPLAIEMVRTGGLRERWGIAYIVAVVAAENSFAHKMYPGLLLGDLATIAVFAMILVVLLRKTKSFLLSVVGQVQAPASVAASPTG
jgi:hypothetical protein